MPSSRSLDYILEVKDRLRGFRVAVEFRNHMWTEEGRTQETLRFLKSNELTYVCVDEPQGFRSSLPSIAELTADIAYVRFHGRNAGTWEKKGITAAERFDWYYTEEEFNEWVPRIRELDDRADEVHLLMNTNRYDQGPANARLLANLLQIPLPGLS